MSLLKELAVKADKNFKVSVRYDGNKVHEFKVAGVRDAIHARRMMKDRADFKELKNPEILKAVEIKEAAEDDEVVEPRVIAKAGDFQVLLMDDEQVMLQNIKARKDLAQMPLVIWKQLTRAL